MITVTKNEDFIFEIIHDIKAPISSIDFALKDIKRDNLLEEIFRINRHNLNYIENLISGYSISKGKYCLKYEIVDVLKIIHEELQALDFLIKEKNLSIEIKKVDDTFIPSDKALVRQIVLNLLTNAIKYTPRNEYIKIYFEKKGGYLSVCFLNVFQNSMQNIHKSKLGLEIIKKKIKILGGKFKTSHKDNEICFNVEFQYR